MAGSAGGESRLGSERTGRGLEDVGESAESHRGHPFFGSGFAATLAGTGAEPRTGGRVSLGFSPGVGFDEGLQGDSLGPKRLLQLAPTGFKGHGVALFQRSPGFDLTAMQPQLDAQFRMRIGTDHRCQGTGSKLPEDRGLDGDELGKPIHARKAG